MEWIVKRDGGSPGVTPQQVKLCELCGTLNHRKNAECHTCGWRGQFDQDEGMIRLAWACLIEQYEEVRMEHVVGRRACLGELGTVERVTGWQRMQEGFHRWWDGLRAERERRAAGREWDHLPPQETEHRHKAA